MKIVLFSRAQMAHNPDELKALFELLGEFECDYCVNEEFASIILSLTDIKIPHNKQYTSLEAGMQQDAVMISYGGDGTFLDCVRLLRGADIPVLGVNSGRLGFLANVPKDAVRSALTDIRDGRFSIVNRPLLLVEGDFEQKPDYPYAFNEFSIQRSRASMISVETLIDNDTVATYWGDGVLLSTPAGSTAYSLSVGGPVVAPGCECFVLSPIAPHNLTMRPVVMPNSAQVTFKLHSRDGGVSATIDNMSFSVDDGATFRVSKSKKSVFLVQLQNISFYDTLSNKMMWGFDRRDEVKY